MKIPGIGCLIVIVAFTLSCSASRVQKDEQHAQATAHYRLGVSFLNEKKVQQAFVEFHKALELNPKDKEIINAIGITYLLHLEDIPKAIVYFERAVAVAPDYSEAYNNLGYAHYKSGNYEKAVPLYQKAISNPLYITVEKAYYNLGNAYYRLGKYESALAAYREVLKREPGLSPPYMGMALCYNKLGRYADAATAMDEAVRLDPAYNGSREKAIEALSLKKLRVSGAEEADLRDYLDILRY
ncbi:MAG: tetratricopeptide repeat protein [Nitrospirae bacterium]|nr:tetratricopeptide repeat protein [Nitrospirota bacterium]